jgi:acetyl-CoA carboxylase biotin carboxyl carrier protein
MTIEEIKELLQIFNESGVAEMEVQRGDNRLRIRRAGTMQEYLMPAPVPQGMSAAPVAYAPQAGGASTSQGASPGSNQGSNPGASQSTAKAPEADSGQVLVKSPIVGTYYDAPAPDSPSFVRVGDRVEPGQVLCIIESMKLMNEIESEVSGIVAAKLVENGRPVEYGEALFAIRPL